MSGSGFVVYFEGTAGLEDAARALRDNGVTVARGDGVLRVRDGGPELRVCVSADPHVPVEAAEVAGDHGVAAIARCTRRFEVSFDDLDEVLDESTTLMMVQAALQDLTRGHIHLMWNDELVEPEAG